MNGSDSATNTSALIRKLWQYCNILRDDGLSYPDYVEQLTYLLFLKMSDELSDGPIPKSHGWSSFATFAPQPMHDEYSRILSQLSRYDGMLGLIFRNARNKVRDPAKLWLLVVDLIGQIEWIGLSDDLKGDAYEGLLEKNARDTKSGAGQYFTPRPLVRAIVDCVNPKLGEVVCDPACGTCGFLLRAYEHLRRNNPVMSHEQGNHLHTQALRGVEIVEEVARLGAMNLLLHGIAKADDRDIPISCMDSLAYPPKDQVDVVLTNPPFGIKGSVARSSSRERTHRNTDHISVLRSDFWVQTANKQLNFLQHVSSLLKPNGRAAVVIPDNVLFESGAAITIRRRLLEEFDVHTLLRLPRGLFYAQQVSSNVLFFDRTAPSNAQSETLWVYDLRTDNRFSLKTKPLGYADLEEFVTLYRPNSRLERSENTDSWRWKSFAKKELIETEDYSLDLTWSPQSKPSQSATSRLDEISQEIAEDLRHALDQITRVSGGK